MAEAVLESFHELLERYPLDIVVPHAVRGELHRKGVAASVSDDVRNAPRFRTNGLGILSWISSPIPIETSHPIEQVIVRDLSKSGIGLLTCNEWYPDEVAKLRLEAGELTLRVVRARRIGTKCCEVGGKILSFDPSPSAD